MPDVLAASAVHFTAAVDAVPAVPVLVEDTRMATGPPAPPLSRSRVPRAHTASARAGAAQAAHLVVSATPPSAHRPGGVTPAPHAAGPSSASSPAHGGVASARPASRNKFKGRRTSPALAASAPTELMPSSATLRIRVVLLKAKGQPPLLSTEELNQAARDAHMVLGARGNSSSSVTTYVLSSPTLGTHTVHAQTENGYTMFHGTPAHPSLPVAYYLAQMAPPPCSMTRGRK